MRYVHVEKASVKPTVLSALHNDDVNPFADLNFHGTCEVLTYVESNSDNENANKTASWLMVVRDHIYWKRVSCILQLEMK